MTAIITQLQPKHGLIHVASDGAHYSLDGVVRAFGSKIYGVSHWPGFVVNLGNGGATPLLGQLMSKNFYTFDELVAGVEDELPAFVEICELSSGADVVIGGISEDRGPEAYMFKTDGSLPLQFTEEEAAAAPPPLKLVQVDNVISPMPIHQLAAAGWGSDHPGPDDDPGLVVWDIKRILTAMHHTPGPPGFGGIGGFGEIMSVGPDGIHTRIVERWNDCLDEPVIAPPLDWGQWYQENPKPRAGVIEVPAGTSRLKREMAARKARKHNLALVD